MSQKPFARVLALGRTLPGIEESLSYGMPALKVRNKFLARMKEDGQTLVFKCADMDEKEFLLQTAPTIFFETDHYKGWTSLLLHLDRITDDRLFALLEQGWRREAGKKLVAAYDKAQNPAVAPPLPAPAPPAKKAKNSAAST